jgi:phage terminase large subunit-like protein
MDLAALASSPAAFRRALRIDAGGSTVPFRPDPWQEQDFAALDPAWLRCAGRAGPEPAITRRYAERSRGHAKTSDLAIEAAWILTFAARPVKGVGAAGDRDQAALLRDAIQTLCRCNGWLAEILWIGTDEVKNIRTGSRLEIITSDVATSYGELPDFVIIDEFCHWPREALWHSLFSAAAKRASCVLVVGSNAGFQESWQWAIREAIRREPAWLFSRCEGPLATWLTPARLEEQRRILPPLVYDRLWLNRWTPGAGDALTSQDIEACCVLPGPMPSWAPGWSFAAGLDLSISRDASALVVVGVHRHGRVRLADCRAWLPRRGEHVDLIEIEAAVLDVHRRYRRPLVSFDIFQAELMAQRLKRAGCRMHEVSFVGKSAQLMASELLEAFKSRRIALFRDEQLLADLRRLRIVEKPSGWRLDAPRTSAGHSDRAVALALALIGARERGPTRSLMVAFQYEGEIMIMRDGPAEAALGRRPAMQDSIWDSERIEQDYQRGRGWTKVGEL